MASGNPLPIRLYAGMGDSPSGWFSLVDIQFSDGRIDDGTVHEPPQVYLRQGLTARQARELIATLSDVVDTIDGWVAR